MAADKGKVFPGLDGLRLLGMVLVSAQHFLTLNGQETWTTLWSLSLGSLGVAIFCALSGFLAFQDQRPAGLWLRRRCWRVLPAYWIVLAVSFGLTWLFQYKTFDGWQILAQFAGIGLFTHPDTLVNVATWFLSVLLLCYALAFLVKALHWPLRSMGGIAAGLFVLLATVSSLDWLGHVITFCVAALGSPAMGTKKPRRVCGGVALSCFILAFWYHPMAYAGVSVLLLAGALAVRAPGIVRVQVLTGLSYEYYLVHGIVFVGCFRVLSLPASLALLCAVLASLLGAAGLRAVTAWLPR